MQSDRIITYREMCNAVGIQTLQRGMNFEIQQGLSIILMSLRSNAPYADRVEDNGRTLIYEGHDCPRTKDGPDPKSVDQPEFNPSGKPTQNGLFHHAAQSFKNSLTAAVRVRVYQKIWSGVWSDNGIFELVDSWREHIGGRSVFKFKLVVADERPHTVEDKDIDITHSRIIPLNVKLTVWKRDRGQCVICGKTDNLHFDHIIPFSLGGSSLVAENIQILCARHNLEKHDKIA
jgi:hypothetical protein